MDAIAPLGVIPLLIVGAGGFGREVLELVEDINRLAPRFLVEGFLDDGSLAPEFMESLRARVLGPTSMLAQIDAAYVIGIGTPAPRQRIDELARQWGRRAVPIVHPAATIGRDVRLGDGAIIAAGARLTANATIGRHAHVNLNCTIGHDGVVEDFGTLYAGVHLGGGVVIEQGATIGTGAVVLPSVRVGRGAQVGAGAVVVRDVPPGTTVVGPSARPTLSRSDDAS
jgi:sugar O-acyltransferase (sialic acid O-acetyltransferase NeuD family)